MQAGVPFWRDATMTIPSYVVGMIFVFIGIGGLLGKTPSFILGLIVVFYGIRILADGFYVPRKDDEDN